MRLIDADRFIEKVNKDRQHECYLHCWTADDVLKRLDSYYAPTVEAISKDQYESRLKADMVAMLEDLDLQIDEIPIVTRHGITGTVMTAQGMRKKIKENIQQKIDALKEQTDGNDSK